MMAFGRASIVSVSLVLSALAPYPAQGSENALHRARAESAVDGLRARYGKLRALWRGHQPGPHLITGLKLSTRGATATAKAARLLQENEALLGGVSARALRPIKVSRSKARTAVYFQMTHKGAPVFDHTLAVTLNADGQALRLSSDLAPADGAKPAKLNASQARAAVVAAYPKARLDGALALGWRQLRGHTFAVWRAFVSTRQGALQVDVHGRSGHVIQATPRLVH